MRHFLFLFLICATAAVLAESAAGLQWTAPAGWKVEAPRPMRAATYMVAPVAGDRDSAECGIFFFGAGQGGSIEANLERWKGQFRGPGGKPAAAKTSRRTINGLNVTLIEAAGEFVGVAGPMMAAGEQGLPDYRLLGAIVEGPGGNIFLKFTGPAKTIGANQQKFEALLASFRKLG
jgi:hypothetical protein